MTDTQTQTKPVPKRRRSQLAKSELLMLLACKAQAWADDIAGKSVGVLPFDQWGDDDYFHVIARRYDLTPVDLTRILLALGDEMEGRSVRAGFDEHWDDEDLA